MSGTRDVFAGAGGGPASDTAAGTAFSGRTSGTSMLLSDPGRMTIGLDPGVESSSATLSMSPSPSSPKPLHFGLLYPRAALSPSFRIPQSPQPVQNIPTLPSMALGVPGVSPTSDHQSPASPRTPQKHLDTHLEQPRMQRQPSATERAAKVTREFRDTWIVE